MAGRVGEVRIGGGRGEKESSRLMCYMYIVSNVVWNCFKSVYCHWSLVYKPQHRADSYQSVNASFSTHVQPGLCFFVVFPHLAANLWPRSPPTGQIFLESCNLRAPHMLEAVPFGQKPGFPCFLTVTSASKCCCCFWTQTQGHPCTTIDFLLWNW